MDSKVIFGIFVILIGVSIILNHVFKIDFPLFRIAFAAFIIFLGFKILTGSFGKDKSNFRKKDNLFSGSSMSPGSISRDEEFNVIFGSSVIDLRSTNFEQPETDIEVNAVFGEAKIFLPPNVRIRIKSSSVFGAVRTPDGRETNFGDSKSIIGDESSSVRINLEANTVFGSVSVFQK